MSLLLDALKELQSRDATPAPPQAAESPAPTPEPAATAESEFDVDVEHAPPASEPDSEADVPPAAPELAPVPPPPPATVRRTVSQEVARQLHAAGARYCFTVPAEPILPLLDDLEDVGVRIVTTRHEGGAAFMA